MAGMTNSLANILLGWYFTPNVHWLALHSTDPTAQGLAGGEIEGGSYIRQQITWTQSSNRTVLNSNAIVFHNLPASTVNYFGIWTQQSGGVCDYVLQVPPLNFNSGGTFTVPVNDISITFV